MTFDWKDTFTMDPVYDAGTYEAPSWTLGDDFFTFDPKETGGIDWSTIYANPDVLSGSGDNFGSDLLKNSLSFISDYAKGSGTEEQSQYFDAQKAASGLPTDKSRDSWYQQISPSVGIYGGGAGGAGGAGGGIYGGGGAGSMVLPAIQGTQSLAGMQGMPSMGFKDVVGAGMRMAGQQLANKALYAINPVLGAVNQFYPGGATEAFKDVTRFAGGIGNTISKGIGGVVDGVGDFFGNLFCDERLKVDIAPLESTEVNDKLAQMAFFVKDLRECS